jgi:hypothetical protein
LVNVDREQFAGSFSIDLVAEDEGGGTVRLCLSSSGSLQRLRADIMPSVARSDERE